MASPNIWPQGFGTVGPSFATLAGNYLVGTARFVDSVAGSDANTGLVPGLPKKTWSATVAAASANDVIFLAPSFTETISGVVNIAVANLTTVGLGSGATQPAITTNVAGTAISFNAAGSRIYGVSFPAGAAAGVKIASTSTNAVVSQCVFAAGSNDTQCIKVTAGSGLTVENCAFTASGTPTNAIQSASGPANVILRSCTFDGGASGWGGYAVDFVTVAPTALDVRDVQLLNKSGFRVGITGSTYSIFGLRPGDSTTCPIVITA